jgi:glycerophosphoryl diester phosphodiesterase
MHVAALYAHRFGRAYGPDSSLRALERTLSGQIAGVETDCCLTADGEIALLHDPLLSRCTTLAGWSEERTMAEIAQAHLLHANGQPSTDPPLRLGEALERLASRDLIVQLEVKAYADASAALRTADLVLDHALAGPVPAERLEIIAFWPEAVALAAARGVASRLIVACAYVPEALAMWAVERGVHGVILEGSYFSDEVVDTWRAAGLSVMSGVVNDIELLRRVLAFEPDAVATDRPHELHVKANGSP